MGSKLIRRNLAIIFSSVLIIASLCYAQKGSIIPPIFFGGASTPAGVAPVLIGPTTGIGCAGNGGSCNFATSVTNVGDTLLWSWASSSGNVDNPSSDHGETITCAARHNYLTIQSRVCWLLTAGTGSYAITNLSSDGTNYNAGVILEIQCAESPSSLCVIDQGPAYADTAGTGSAGTTAGGTITTTHQLNELILGGATVAYPSIGNFTGTPTQVSPYVICPPEISSVCIHEGAFAAAYALMERYNATATGTFQASTTWDTVGNTSFWTMSIY